MDARATRSAVHSRRIRIGEQIFDRRSGEIWTPGEDEARRLRPRVARLLTHFVERPGRLCTRRELQELLWGDREVDAEQGLNACIREIRRSLGDDAAKPTVLETLPGRGYRLIAPISWADAARPAGVGSRGRLLAACAALLLVATAVAAWRWVDPEQPPAAQIIDGRARELLQEAEYLAKSGDSDALTRSARLLDRALSLEPEWALAQAKLAQVAFALGEPDRARSLARSALSLDPRLAEAHAAVGFFAFYDRLAWDEARHHLQRAVELDPASPAARLAFAHVLSAWGRNSEAVEQMRIAVELDPVDARLRGDAGWIFYWARLNSEAISHAHRALELAPGDMAARICLFNALVASGDLSAAAEHLDAVARASGLPASARAALRRQPVAERVRAYWLHLGGADRAPSADPWGQRLRALGQLGRRDAVREELAWLAGRTAAADLLLLRQDPLLDPVRDG